MTMLLLEQLNNRILFPYGTVICPWLGITLFAIGYLGIARNERRRLNDEKSNKEDLKEDHKENHSQKGSKENC